MNARAIEGTTIQSLMRLEREVFSLLAENAELMTKGGWHYDTLSDAELYGYERVVGSYMSLIYSAFIQHERDLVEDEVWQAYVNALGRHIKAPGFAAVWENIKIGYPASFQAEVARHYETAVIGTEGPVADVDTDASRPG